VPALGAYSDFSPPSCIAVGVSTGVMKHWSPDISVVCNQPHCPTYRKRFLRISLSGREKVYYQSVALPYVRRTKQQSNKANALRGQVWVPTNMAVNSRRLLFRPVAVCTLSRQYLCRHLEKLTISQITIKYGYCSQYSDWAMAWTIRSSHTGRGDLFPPSSK
jgi:hypothetical protein